MQFSGSFLKEAASNFRPLHGKDAIKVQPGSLPCLPLSSVKKQLTQVPSYTIAVPGDGCRIRLG